ncbi:MAG: heat-inducible transcription repressor HrcA [Elusimicrobia bacterium]|nr:heat-inducible transcription repressor HrcA [Elusimicrobiota bacterium]MBD3412248.1 heat-inducible transcription repressor HrcA [Elusimicrobiota bacterium]
MRALRVEDQEDRKKKVLQSVIHHYIKTARPVGSKMLTEMGVLGLSSATIRHILSDLEDEGYITHPHTSAGRVPTDKGYRYYVETLSEIQRLAIAERERIKKEYLSKIAEHEQLMGVTSRILSTLSHYTGFVISPKLELNRLRHIELVSLDDNKLLIIMVTDSGIVKHHVIQTEHSLSEPRLHRLNNMLNDKLAGLSLREVHARIIGTIEEEEREYQQMITLARQLAESVQESEEELFLDGVGNLVSQIDFDDINQMKSVFKLVDEKKMLSQIIRKQISKEGTNQIRVTIGEDLYPQINTLSVISSVYNLKGNNVGVLGIIGPKRMEYARMMGLVEYVSEIVNSVLDEFEKR